MPAPVAPTMKLRYHFVIRAMLRLALYYCGGLMTWSAKHLYDRIFRNEQEQAVADEFSRIIAERLDEKIAVY